MTRDERWMHIAIEEATDALCAGEIPVGAVIVLGDTVITRAHNLRETQHDVTAHAEILALQTVLGTARLIDETTLTPQTAREAICSPGGTTLAALDAMSAAGFAPSIDKGIAAAVKRSKELAQS